MDNQKKKVLIVEDETPILRIITTKLTENGFETITANNGQDGLMLALQKHPDIILLDVLMPKMDGITTITKLRQDSWGQTVPVIILTNVSPDTDKTLQTIINNKPAYYLVKSDIKLDELVEKVKEVLTPK